MQEQFQLDRNYAKYPDRWVLNQSMTRTCKFDTNRDQFLNKSSSLIVLNSYINTSQIGSNLSNSSINIENFKKKFILSIFLSFIYQELKRFRFAIERNITSNKIWSVIFSFVLFSDKNYLKRYFCFKRDFCTFEDCRSCD